MNELRIDNPPPAKVSVSPAGKRPARPSGQVEKAEAGNTLPPRGKSRPVEPPPIDLKSAVEQLNQYLRDSHRSLVFEMNEELGRTVIRVVNPVTKEVIREIPPDAARIMAASLRGGQFSLVDTRV